MKKTQQVIQPGEPEAWVALFIAWMVFAVSAVKIWERRKSRP